jgi:hypothetical protein
MAYNKTVKVEQFIIERLEKAPALSYRECISRLTDAPLFPGKGLGEDSSVLIFLAEAPGQRLDAWRKAFGTEEAEPFMLAVVNRKDKDLVTVLHKGKNKTYLKVEDFRKLWQQLSNPRVYPITRWVETSDLKNFNGWVRQVEGLGFGHKDGDVEMKHLTRLIAAVQVPSKEQTMYDPFEL